MGDLTDMEDLQISYNLQINEMPVTTRKLSKMKRFHFCNTKFDEFPSFLENWTDLLELYFYDNSQIDTIPGKVLYNIYY